MEVVSTSLLEFGDFEPSVTFFSNDKCVELPSSWQLHSSREYLDCSSNDEDVCNKTEQPACNKAQNEIKSLSNNSDLKLKSESGSANDAVMSEITLQAKKDKSASNEKSVICFSQVLNEPNGCDESLKTKASSKIAVDVKLPSNPTAQNNVLEKTEKIIVANGNVDAQEKSTIKAVSGWANLFRHQTNLSSTVTSKIPNGEDCAVENQLPIESKEIKENFNVHSAETMTENRTVTTTKLEDDPSAKVLAKVLKKLELKFKPQAFIPRGLINSSNWCYINATLQALLMCPPFFQLFKSLPKVDKNRQTFTPVLDCFIDLASDFFPLSTKKGYQLSREIRQGPPFTPDCVYKMLSSTNSSLSENGSQEDAEEFLSFVLNGLHEEMCSLDQLIQDESEDTLKENENDSSNINSQCSEIVSDGEEWEEVIGSKRNKTAVTRRADQSKTLMSQIFRGELCTSVTRSGQKLSISHEPFYSLPLTFSGHDQYWSVEDALYALTDKESFSGSENSQNVTRQQLIEVLPPILILHLKRFVYNKNGGLKKIERRMDFRSDLMIAKDFLSKTSKRYSSAQRTYKLFAVVCHHGERATGGHYTADVFHIGMSSWLRIDDQNIQTVSHNEVTRHSSNRSPYLLFYRRTDLG